MYYSYHEETRILPVHAQRPVAGNVVAPAMPTPVPPTPPPLLLHARLIDDAFQIWDAANLPPNVLANFTSHMSNVMKFGILDWEVDTPAKKVNFLDLTIQLETDGTITTRTYVKPMNLHLYIPPLSAHPLGVLKSLIFGNLQRYWIQNSHRHDFVAVASSFHGHLLNRGYSRETLTPLFQEAGARIHNKCQQPASTGDQLWDPSQEPPTDHLFVHWDYHPRCIGRSAIRQIFDETLAHTLSESGLTVGKLTIAYSTPRSLGQCLTKTQLEEPSHDRVSSYIEPMEPPSANL